MLDIIQIRENTTGIKEALRRRGDHDATIDQIISLDNDRKSAETYRQQLLKQQNELSGIIQQMVAYGHVADDKKDEVRAFKQQISEVDAHLTNVRGAIKELMLKLPNVPEPDVPHGTDETHNVVISEVGDLPNFSFKPKHHYELSEKINFEQGAALSGSRFVVLHGEIARLERAIGQFLLDAHPAYDEVSVPLLVNQDALIGTGQLPKFEDDLFRTDGGQYLIPTAEVPLTNLIAGEISSEEGFYFKALTHCFRAEAGAAGKDTRGLIRQHQFQKVELVAAVCEKNSDSELSVMLKSVEDALTALGLPYRVVLLCDGDMGFSAKKTYDIEVWFPAQNCYREISSISNCGDFQSRRMNARYRPKGNKVQYYHTLNGSGVAVGRALAAILENYQNEDGTIRIPPALVPYMGRYSI